MMPIAPPGQYLPGHTLSTGALLRLLSTPVIATGALFLSCHAFAEPFAGPYLILALLVFALTFHSDTPEPGVRRRPVAVEVMSQWLLVTALLLVLGWATHTLNVFDSRVIGAWVLLTPAVLTGGNLLINRWMPRVMAATGMQRVAIIAGGCELARKLADGIAESPQNGIRVAGFFDDRAAERLPSGSRRDILGGLSDIAAYAKANHVDLIYITLPMTSQPRILKLVDELRDTTASIYFVPDIFLFDLIQARMDTLGGLPVVAVCETPYYGVNALIKRSSDLVLASAILLLIAPVMLAIAIAIKHDSPGPVIFKQRRYGLDGREIIIYKFRSMTVCEDGGEIRQASRDDCRVTKLGAFLRATSLDELPQFINVLQGRMSVVGPRPHAVAHNELYRKLINGYMIRHKVKPGITGWAQINGLRGETTSVERMSARIEYDLAYLRNWSLLLDLKIICKTPMVVLKRENAY